jgi:hypothetical protein
VAHSDWDSARSSPLGMLQMGMLPKRRKQQTYRHHPGSVRSSRSSQISIGDGRFATGKLRHSDHTSSTAALCSDPDQKRDSAHDRTDETRGVQIKQGTAGQQVGERHPPQERSDRAEH